MQAIGINRKELKKILHETFSAVLAERKDVIVSAVLVALEDIGLARAMEIERTDTYLNTGDFKKKLNSKLRRSK